MCGVFGFVSKTGKGPSLRTLQTIARVTERRGPHAFGFAWIDQAGRMRAFRGEGRISDYLGLLEMAAGARLLVGHCRYATHGSPEQIINNHPHPCDGGWICHNGQVANLVDLLVEHEFSPTSECDSEVIGLLIENSPARTTLLRCIEAVDQVTGKLALLGLWKSADGGRLVAIRRGKPLHVGETEHSIYLASLADGLPGKPQPVEAGRAIEWRRQGRGRRPLKRVQASVLDEVISQ